MLTEHRGFLAQRESSGRPIAGWRGAGPDGRAARVGMVGLKVYVDGRSDGADLASLERKLNGPYSKLMGMTDRDNVGETKIVADTIPTRLITRGMLSVVLRMDVCFTKGHGRKRVQGSGFILDLRQKQSLDTEQAQPLRKLMTDFVFLGAIAPPPTVFVTCRHVVDYYYSKQEPCWELSNLVIQCFPEGGSPFPTGQLSRQRHSCVRPERRKAGHRIDSRAA